jgi:hypothetical protein
MWLILLDLHAQMHVRRSDFDKKKIPDIKQAYPVIFSVTYFTLTYGLQSGRVGISIFANFAPMWQKSSSCFTEDTQLFHHKDRLGNSL